MDIPTEQVIDALLEEVKRLTLENAALKVAISSVQQDEQQPDGDE